MATGTGRKQNTIDKENERLKKKDPGTQRRGSSKHEPDLPPNDHIRKDADEVYGDTELPHR